jgi:Phage tail tube protein, TTP
MAITRATGTLVAIASTYGTASVMSAITNATEAVATLAGGHGVVVGDYLEVTSGWDLLTARIVRAKTVATNDVTFEGISTTDTSRYPVGTGAGSIRRITAWTNISQITRDFGVSGGGQNYANITTLVDQLEKQIPTTRSPVEVTLPVYDDPSLSWYATVSTASDTAAATAVRMSFPNSSKLVGNAYWSLQTVPTIEDSTLRSQINLSFAAQPTRYTT